MKNFKTLIYRRISNLLRAIHRNHITIFMIHGVIDSAIPTGYRSLRYNLSVEKFSKGLSKLTKTYQFVSIEKATAMILGTEPQCRNIAVLTFDDGYKNNISHALPILNQFDIPATFFLATGHVDRREPFWYDRFDYAIQHLRKEQEITFCGRRFLFKPQQESDSRLTFATLRKMIKENNRPYATTMLEVNEIASLLEINAGARLVDNFENDHFSAIMSWDDAKLATEKGITIGSHTVNHPMLDKIDKNSIQRELIESRNTIEKYTGKQCPYFCYPYGRWNDQIVSMVKKAGYAAAITTDKGTNRFGSDTLVMRRVGFPEVD